MTRLTSKLALAGVAAVGLYLPSMGLPLPLNSCQPTLGVANAAPSPTCASDLRECLRQSADLRQTTFGGRYVTAEDVARCMEAFRSCISGGAKGGGNASPPQSTAAGGNERKGLPQRLGITVNDIVSSDCLLSGNSFTCTDTRRDQLPADMDSWTSQTTGTVSGMTMTGTQTIHIEGHLTGETGCRYTTDITGPATYVFSPDGKVTIRGGPMQAQETHHGSCSYSDSQTTPGTESTGTWSPK
jgi:hypothetical protein